MRLGLKKGLRQTLPHRARQGRHPQQPATRQQHQGQASDPGLHPDQQMGQEVGIHEPPPGGDAWVLPSQPPQQPGQGNQRQEPERPQKMQLAQSRQAGQIAQKAIQGFRPSEDQPTRGRDRQQVQGNHPARGINRQVARRSGASGPRRIAVHIPADHFAGAGPVACQRHIHPCLPPSALGKPPPPPPSSPMIRTRPRAAPAGQ